MAANVLKFQNYETPEVPGTHYRLLCMTGKNKGISYFLSGKRAVMGRGDNADIQVLDIKSSREHAEVTVVGDEVYITDLGSQNGLVVNDLKIKQHKLKDGDKIFIGQTVYKYSVIDVKANLKAVDGDDVEEWEEEEEQNKSKLPLILMAVAVMGAFILLSEDENNSVRKVSKKKQEDSYRSSSIGDEFAEALIKKKHAENKVLKEKLNVIFQRGLREYREGNYFRAMSEFNLALYLSPNDALATFYMNKTKDALHAKVKEFERTAARDIESLKYRSALTSYCAIIRLLYNYKEDPRYKSAEKKIKELEGKLGMDPGEANCIKK